MTIDFTITAVVGLVSGISAFVGVAIGHWLSYRAKRHETNLQMLEIALGILREDPDKSQLAAARSWAIDVVNKSSPVQMDDEVRRELTESPIMKLPPPSPEFLDPDFNKWSIWAKGAIEKMIKEPVSEIKKDPDHEGRGE